MKALKSPLAKELLADPEARARLRSYLSSAPQTGSELTKERFVIQFKGTNGKTKTVVPVVIPKAA